MSCIVNRNILIKAFGEIMNLAVPVCQIISLSASGVQSESDSVQIRFVL